MILVVLASGRGSRLGKITDNKPKCLIKIHKNRTLLDHLSEKFYLFKKIIIVTGYKSKILEKNLKKKNVIFIKNKNYMNTNMVESLMLCSNKIDEDIIITYSDILYDGLILKKISKMKGNILPVNKNWFISWKKRYQSLERIKRDAEDLIINKSKVISIGGKIKKKLPKYQYMGILKVEKKSFFKIYNYYNLLKNKKITMTNFIDLAIKNKQISLKFKIYDNYWYEIDNRNDLRLLFKETKKFF